MAVIDVMLGAPATHAAMPVAVVISSLQFWPSTRTTSCNVTSFELCMLRANFGRIPPITGLINLASLSSVMCSGVKSEVSEPYLLQPVWSLYVTQEKLVD